MRGADDQRRTIPRDLLGLLAQVTGEFVALPASQLGAAIDRTLATIGRMFDVDRAYLFEFAGDGFMSNTHEWVGEGVTPEIENLQVIPVDVFPWWMERLGADLPVNLASLDDLPPHAVAERAILEPQRIKSLLVLPVAWRGKLDGFIGFDHVRSGRRWTDEEVDVLRIVASAIAQSIERQAIDRRLELADSVFQHAHEGIFATDGEQRILEVNPMFTEITGYSRDEALGRTPNMLSSGRHGPDFYAGMWSAIAATGHWRGDVWNRRRNGELYLERLAISAVRGADGSVERYVGVFADITRLKEQEERLEQMAYYDALTKLPNRTLLADRMAQALAQVRRGGHRLAVCYLDLDAFKPVNDAHGHAAGDRLLVETSHRLKGALRTGDTVARLGGDEFVLLLPGLASDAECRSLVARILHCVAEPFEVSPGHPVALTASVGVRMVPPDDADPDTILRQADQALYAAKQEGRGRAHWFDPEQDRLVVLRRDQVARIVAGLEMQEMRLHFQPIVDIESGELRVAEALVRWQSADRGLLSPAEWLPAIDGHESMARLGDWILDEALAACARWTAAGIACAVSVNASGTELRDPAFADRVRAALSRHPGVDPSMLRLEVLESAAISDMTAVSRTMAECGRMGVRFALDDFGTGYSSLTLLKRLPANTIKIDRTFVADMLTDPGDRAIVVGVVELARVFGRRSVAEGVETEDHLHALRQVRCDLAQGYGIAPPMPEDAFVRWASGRRAGGPYTSGSPCRP
jgi:diguanylate cyclase (GGDEF)-like protein/PAS domain S-box-containing protein